MEKIALIAILASFFAGSVSAASACASCACSDKDSKMTKAGYGQAKSIVATAAGNEDFSTLVAAVKAAGLVETLSGEGPYTVFAPTNEAFAALPAGTVENLLKPENKAQLVEILTYHVVPAKVMAKDVKAGEAPTVNGKPLQVSTQDGVQVNGAKVVATDIVCSNGVIHVVDQVILPPSKQQG